MAKSNITDLSDGNLVSSARSTATSPRQAVAWAPYPLYAPPPSSAVGAVHDHIHRSHSEQPVIERQFSRYRPSGAVYSEGGPRASSQRENSPTLPDSRPVVAVAPTPYTQEVTKMATSPEERASIYAEFLKSRETPIARNDSSIDDLLRPLPEQRAVGDQQPSEPRHFVVVNTNSIYVLAP